MNVVRHQRRGRWVGPGLVRRCLRYQVQVLVRECEAFSDGRLRTLFLETIEL
jgi:hypothetical protein